MPSVDSQARLSVSVVIPTHNRARLLRDAIDSVLCGQDNVPTEIIVVDDCSTDETRAVVSAYGQTIISRRLTVNVGAGEARNEGLRLATGAYVKFLDSDDVLCPGTLTNEVRCAKEAEADMVLSGWGTVEIDSHQQSILGTERVFDAPDMSPLPDTLLLGRAAPTSAVLYRRRYIQDLRWDSTIRRPDDWHFFCLAAIQLGKIVTRRGQAYWLRDHAGSRVNAGPQIVYARNHHRILQLMEDALVAKGLLDARRRAMLAQYYYKQIYVLAGYDREGFEKAVEHILDLDPSFQPVTYERKPYMRLLARGIGFRRAVLAYSSLKRLLLPWRD